MVSWRRGVHLFGVALCLALGACGGRASDGDPSNDIPGSENAEPGSFAGAPSDTSNEANTPDPRGAGGDSAMGATETLFDGPLQPLRPITLRAACAAGMPSLPQVFGAMRERLASVPPSERRFLRFVSITGDLESSCRNQRADDELRDLRRHWSAVSKMMNGLSLRPEAVVPQALSRWPSLLQIDLRDYGWEAPLRLEEGGSYTDHWEAVAARAGQRIPLAGDDARAVARESASEVPLLLSSDLLASASQAPLYYELLHLPSTLQQLRASFGIGEPQLSDPALWARAGFSTSGVSKQNAAIANYTGELSGTSLYWERYDYLPESSFPGPYAAPLERGADQYSVMFSLPNGLYGYMLADASGARLTRGFENIDIDPAQRGGTLNAAASCTSCHNYGLIPFTDQVRESVEARPQDYDTAVVQGVQLSYPTVEALSRRVEAHSDPYRDALERAGQLPGTADPSARIFLQYDLGLLWDRMAGELFVTEAELFEALPRLPPEFTAAEFLGTMERSAFNRHYTEALCVLNGSGSVADSGNRCSDE